LIHNMAMVYEEITDNYYASVDLSNENPIALVCTSESDSPTGLQRWDLTPLITGGRRPNIENTEIVCCTRREVETIERAWRRNRRKLGVDDGPLKRNDDGSIIEDLSDENYDNFSSYVFDDICGIGASAKFIDDRVVIANALGTVRFGSYKPNSTTPTDPHRFEAELVLYGDDKDLDDDDARQYDMTTKQADEVNVGSHRINGWLYYSFGITNGKGKVTIVHVRVVPESDDETSKHIAQLARALFRALFPSN